MKSNTTILFCLFATSIFCQTNFKISDGYLKITANVDLVLKDAKWVNNGTFTATNGTVYITGTTTQANSSIEGTNETTFNKLTINKSSNGVQLGQNINIENTVTLTKGKLELNNNNVVLNGSFTIQNGHYFQTSGTGKLSQTITMGATRIFPVGNDTYTPMTLKNDGSADVFSVRSAPEVLVNGASGTALTSNVVDRTWFITEAVAGGSDLTLTANWNASDEMIGFDRTQCYLSHYTDSGWNGISSNSATGSGPYSVIRSGITSLSLFAVGSSHVLPIELVEFYAFRADKNVQLEWTTATEINSDVFEIEHSIDAISYKKIGEVRAAIFSNSELSYEFLHKNPFNGINYYRLKMIDLDEKIEYTAIRTVDFGKVENISVYPNPVSDILNVQILNAKASSTLELYNELGQLVFEKTINDFSKTSFSINHLPKGIYWLNVLMEGKQWGKKILIQ